MDTFVGRLAFLLLMTAPLSAFAGTKLNQTCHDVAAGTDGIPAWSYCITRAETDASPDVIYYFHGLDEDDNYWETDYGKVREYWSAHGLAAPTIVSMSFGKLWLLAPLNGSKRSGLLEYVTHTMIPILEAELTPQENGERILMGRSMGGFNATQVLLSTPEFFTRAALLCPALADISPWTKLHNILAYVKRTHASIFQVVRAVLLSRAFFPTNLAWFTGSPLARAVTLLGPRIPPLLVMTNSGDAYGFDEGATALAQLAIAAGVPSVNFSIQSGPHCHNDDDEIARFLVGLRS